MVRLGGCVVVLAWLATSWSAQAQPGEGEKTEAPTKPLSVKASVGQVVRLSPAGESGDDAEKYTTLWQVPSGVSYRPDTNQRDIYAAASAPGSYKIVAITAKNGTPRPQVWLYETTLEVTAAKAGSSMPMTMPPGAVSGALPAVNEPPIASPATASSLATSPNPQASEAFALKLRADTMTIPLAARVAVGKAYLAVARHLDGTTFSTVEEEVRKLNEHLHPLQSADQQRVLGVIGTLATAERTNLGPVVSRHLYRAIAAGLGVTE